MYYTFKLCVSIQRLSKKMTHPYGICEELTTAESMCQEITPVVSTCGAFVA